MNFEKANRLKNLPPYLFAQIDKIKEEKIKEGVDVISLGIGDPDMPTPQHIIDALNIASQDVKNHQYPTYSGMFEFRDAVSKWYKKRFNVEISPQDEVITLIGSKEGIAHIFLAYVDKDDYTLVSDPGYPVYKIGTQLAGGIPFSLPLLEENNFLPDLNSIPKDIARKSKIMFINYPNMPTAATATLEFFEEVVRFAKENNIIVCHDAPYSEISFDGYVAPSFLQAKGAKDVGVEFHSLSKTYNMTGWRIGWVCGNKDIVQSLLTIKTNIDSGVFQAIQYAGISALNGPQEHIAERNKIYQKRRDMVVETLNELGWNIKPPVATFYIWCKIPKNYTSSVDFCTDVLNKTGVIVVPGIGYGEHGEGYFRISLTIQDDKLQEAMERWKKSGIRFK